MNKNSLPEFDQYAARYEADLKQSILSVFAENRKFSRFEEAILGAALLGKRLFLCDVWRINRRDD
jgi:hypothetical protein